MRTEVQTGVGDGEWIEVTNRWARWNSSDAADKGPWVAIDGTEQVLLGDLSILTDGGPVKVATEKAGRTASDQPRASYRPVASTK